MDIPNSTHPFMIEISANFSGNGWSFNEVENSTTFRGLSFHSDLHA